MLLTYLLTYLLPYLLGNVSTLATSLHTNFHCIKCNIAAGIYATNQGFGVGVL